MASYRNSWGRIFWGLILILIGILLLLDRMGRLDFGDLISSYWPLLLVAAGLWHLVSSNFRDLVGGLFLIAVGGVFQLAKLEILGRSAWHYLWPALIIVLGLWVLLGAFRRQQQVRFAGTKEQVLDAFAMFSGLNRRVEAQDFRGGKATAIMGGIELDLTQAKLAEGQASLDLTVIMGGIDVRVPKHFQVVVDGHPLLGGIEDKHTYVPGSGGEQKLHIKASAIMGGIEIKN